MRKISYGRGVSMVALAVAAAGIAPVALAQSSDEIVVTGSHLGKSAFTSPTPVNVIGDERMKSLANPSLADTLNQIPSFRAITSPASNSFRINGNIGARSMDLRGLGTSRTLVLIDGRRFVPSSDNGSVDLNAIPSSLVARAEAVTGGASAAYGADAVAGVVNIILDTKFTGFKTDVSMGIAEAGDAQNYFASAAAGQDFAGGRGHFIVGFEAQKEMGIGSCWARSFCDRHTNYPANAAWTAGGNNALPNTLVRDNVEFVYATNPNIQSIVGAGTTRGQAVTGTQMNAALKNTGFDNNGNLTSFPYGANLGGTFMIGGGNAQFQNVERDQLWGFYSRIITPTKHFSTMGHVDFDLTDKVQLSSSLIYSTVTGRTYGGFPVLTPSIKLTSGQNQLGNPYLSSATRAALIAADPSLAVAGTNATTGARIDSQININVVKPEAGLGNDGTTYNETIATAFGLKGDLDWHNASWDAGGTYGETNGQLKVKNVRLRQFDGGNSVGGATDAVTPPTGYTGPVYFTPTGAPVICASSVVNTNQYNGDDCMPVNLLTPGSLTPAMVAKYFKNASAERHMKQTTFAANFRGDIVSLWAGPITGAIGAEWRKDSAEGTVDALTAANVFNTAQVSALAPVERTVKEGYLEVSIPLLKDVPGAKNLTIDGARRWTNYSTSGDANTWKAGAVYEPVEDILVRVTQSSDIRAPTAAELNPNVVRVLSPLPDPFAPNNNNAARNITALLGGNPGLNLETAVTKTAGLVLKPRFIPGLQVSTDYYNIKVANAIDSFAAATVIPACANLNQLCNLITFEGAFKASNVVSVAANFQNLSTVRANGVEVVANYSFPALGGNFDAMLNANYIMELKSIGATGIRLRLDGVTGNLGAVAAIQGVPQYKLDGVLTYTRDNWSVTAHGRYIPEGILDQGKVGPEDAGYSPNLANSIETNRVDSAAYLDLAGSYSPKAKIFGGNFQIYGSVNNVFDKSEPDQLRLYGNGLQFDPVGRAYRLGIRTNW